MLLWIFTAAAGVSLLAARRPGPRFPGLRARAGKVVR